MGNLSSCFSVREEEDDEDEERRRRRRKAHGRPAQSQEARLSSGSSSRWRKGKADETLAIASLLLQQHQGGQRSNGTLVLPFDRSSSLRYPPPAASGGKIVLPRCASSRPRSVADPLLQPQHLLNQGVKMDELETNKFVLVHGGGFGAWCWYKTIALLEEAAFKVILVGHDFGGTCISYAMEAFPCKIAKAVFVSAAMLTNGQNTLDMFSEEVGHNDLMRQAQIFSYANGNDQPPTAIDLDKSLLRELLFNQSPSKDVALASVSMRPMPFAPILEKLCLTTEKYGSVRRFFIETPEDNAISLPLQQNMTKSNPPEQVFRLKGSDHSPFFSRPQALHKYLVEIAKIPPSPTGQ
ncbi:putative methylesterase 11, chloroplastic isoform X2 [Nymphaea colorata]|uniref:putative methylesterase 11, chloroplastic isoform X2 n=1 Tax=Nymphaea colorata TaxID=210225 RepID=UPI00129E5460|nr:putative methylesterase 11, chloroplastic isoform X2 [Nymphaea colorata]